MDSSLARSPLADINAIHDAVVTWYLREHRDLPWRHTRDPYAVLVSEMMLQQQTVRHVVPVYVRFMERYPDLGALAAAPLAEVIRVWQPLGRYASAVRLHAIARQAAQGDGSLPRTVEGLLAFKGIGRYTAAAVVCFAYGQAEAMVDTNVRRVLSRVFAATAAVPETNARAITDRIAWDLAQDALPTQRAYEWNQGLLDLGAMVCIAGTPRCPRCPVQMYCVNYAARSSAAAVETAATQTADLERRAIAEASAVYTSDVDASDVYTTGADSTKVAALSPGAGSPPVPSLPSDPGARRKRQLAMGQTATRYEGSRRWYRGQIMQALCALPPATALEVDALGARVKPDFAPADRPLLLDLVAALGRDGLLTVDERPDGTMWLALPE